MSNSQTSNKGAPEHNKPNSSGATQKNEAKRTPESRNDREAHVGGSNQSSARRGDAKR